MSLGDLIFVDYNALDDQTTSGFNESDGDNLGDNFQDKFSQDVRQWDEYCVITGLKAVDCLAAPIIPRCKGDEFIQRVIQDCSHLYESTIPSFSSIKAVENGVLLTKTLYLMLKRGAVAFLKLTKNPQAQITSHYISLKNLIGIPQKLQQTQTYHLLLSLCSNQRAYFPLLSFLTICMVLLLTNAGAEGRVIFIMHPFVNRPELKLPQLQWLGFQCQSGQSSPVACQNMMDKWTSGAGLACMIQTDQSLLLAITLLMYLHLGHVHMMSLKLGKDLEKWLGKHYCRHDQVVNIATVVT
ncbi:hypothetical protein EI94DRAFT_1709268 [Lactarius quietus]|nr:hypothetical protein EI94DRAFT_1709268 [Lactarius quietus]